MCVAVIVLRSQQLFAIVELEIVASRRGHKTVGTTAVAL